MDSNDIYSKKSGRDTWISVHNLRVGMFVTELDREWLGSPFLFQGFYISSRDEIDKLSEYCQFVWVKSENRHLFDAKVNFESEDLIGRKPQKYITSSAIEYEHKKIESLVVDLRTCVSKILDEARSGKTVDTKLAREYVNDSVESIIRHPDALAWMVKLKTEDEYTAEHSMNVCILAVIFGRKLGLTKSQLRNLGLCGLLHDIGKMKIPDEILNKPGKLTDEEMKIMKTHAGVGKKMLSEKRDVYEGVVDVAYSHHERPDGKGYPRGLSQESISLFSKIIAIVDSYDAMTCERVYAEAKSTAEALKIIYENRGKQFDEKLALAFIKTIGLYPPGSIVELINGMVGVVLETDSDSRRLPVITIMIDSQKESRLPKTVDLSLVESGELGRDYYIRLVHADGAFGIYLKHCFAEGMIYGDLSANEGLSSSNLEEPSAKPDDQ